MGSKRRGKRQTPPSERRRDRPHAGVLPLERESFHPYARDRRFGAGDAPRLVTVGVPCPECKRCVDAMAYDGAGAQDVTLCEHVGREGGKCPLSGGVVRIPGAASSPDFFYQDLSARPGITEDPLDREHHPVPPASNAPMGDRLKEYAAACPFSTLLKLYLEAGEASDRLFGVDHLFLGDSDVLDHAFWNERADALEEALGQALMARLKTGIGRAGADLSDGKIEFFDEVSGEYVAIPLRSLRVGPNFLTPFHDGDVRAVGPPFGPVDDDVDEV